MHIKHERRLMYSPDHESETTHLKNKAHVRAQTPIIHIHGSTYQNRPKLESKVQPRPLSRNDLATLVQLLPNSQTSRNIMY